MCLHFFIHIKFLIPASSLVLISSSLRGISFYQKQNLLNLLVEGKAWNSEKNMILKLIFNEFKISKKCSWTLSKEERLSGPFSSKV